MPRAALRPRLNCPTPAATDAERVNLRQNIIITCNADGGVSTESLVIAWQSAKRNSKAARIYGAIARSYGVKT